LSSHIYTNFTAVASRIYILVCATHTQQYLWEGEVEEQGGRVGLTEEGTSSGGTDTQQQHSHLHVQRVVC
jgi:hypothetical protein